MAPLPEFEPGTITRIMPCECGGETYIEVQFGDSEPFVVQEPYDPRPYPYREGSRIRAHFWGSLGDGEIQSSYRSKKMAYQVNSRGEREARDCIGEVLLIEDRRTGSGKDIYADPGGLIVSVTDWKGRKVQVGDFVVIGSIFQCCIRSILEPDLKYGEKIRYEGITSDFLRYAGIEVQKTAQGIECFDMHGFEGPDRPGAEMFVRFLFHSHTSDWQKQDGRERAVALQEKIPEGGSLYSLAGEIVEVRNYPYLPDTFETIIDCGFYVHTLLRREEVEKYPHVTRLPFIPRPGDYIRSQKGRFEAWRIEKQLQG